VQCSKLLSSITSVVAFGAKTRMSRSTFPRRALCVVLFIVFASGETLEADASAGRVPWTTSRVHGTPEPPSPYRTERVFAKLRFDEPLGMARASESERLFVFERTGRIYSFLPADDVATRELFLDTGRPNYGMAFHPRFHENGQVFVSTVVAGEPPQLRVSRFLATGAGRLHADPASETKIIAWLGVGHTGGCIKFGPDGFLYIAAGDAAEIGDGHETGQDITDLPGSLLRIDVDRTSQGRPYAIPQDNPFLAVPGARGEVWAYGLRQFWRMNFDRKTGELWGGDIGQDLWESVHRLERGGNYGWSVNEGNHAFRPERPRGPTPIRSPIVEHAHTEARSITGGVVYRGRQLAGLVGAYVYGDYDTGRIWGLRYDGAKVTWHEELVDTAFRIIGFGEDFQGEMYFADHLGGGLHRLVPAPPQTETNEFPRQLSATGLFASVADYRPAPGVTSYTVRAPSWTDGATKEHHLAIPGDGKIGFDGMAYPQPAPGAPPGWKLPHGTVLVQTLSLEMEPGKSTSRRRIETRILQHERIPGTDEMGDQIVRGYTYVWNDEQTDATLFDARGGERTFVLRDSKAPAGERRQTWRFPGRAECSLCHNMAAKFAIGLNTMQLNLEREESPGRTVNQLEKLAELGYFSAPLPAAVEKLPRIAVPHDPQVPLEERARAYLHANCAHCHRKWGGGNAEFRLHYPLTVEEMGIVGTAPGHGAFHLDQPALISPGAPHRSVLLYRLAKFGGGRMPRAGSHVVDPNGARLIGRWIRSLDSPPVEPHLTPALREAREAAASGDADLEGLLTSSSGALWLLEQLDHGAAESPLWRAVVSQAQAAAPSVRDLFERFLPEEQRTRRLGDATDPERLLLLQGDAGRGRKLFQESSTLACRSCHRAEETGVDLGPALDKLGGKLTRAQLLESILQPSKVVAPQYATHVLQTRDGQVHVGIIAERTAESLVLRGTENLLVRVAIADVAQVIPQQQSLMPELQLKDLTAEQVADLLAYLSSLR
jgi:putative heme-binding domain-containing protein